MNNKMSDSATVLKSLLSKQVVSYHPDFAKALGSVSAALFLSQGFFWQEGAKFKESFDIDGERWFTATAADWYDATGLKTDSQETSRKVLKSVGLLFEAKKGIPARIYYRIDFERLVEIMSDFYSPKQVSGNPRNSSTGFPETVAPDSPKHYSRNPRNYYIGREYKESIESIIETDAADAASAVFSVEIFEPSKTEILTLETENTPPPQIAPPPPAPRRAKDSRTAEQIAQVVEIVDYLNSKAGTRHRPNTGDTAKFICARIADGYTPDDMKTVIDHRVKIWLGTSHQIYLRPETLFCQKHFDGYLNAARMPEPKNTGAPKKQAVNDVRGIDYSRPQKF